MPNAEKTTNQTLAVAVFCLIVVVGGLGALFSARFNATNRPDATDANSQSNDSARTFRFQVNGPSMVPTFYGDATWVNCRRCQRIDRVSDEFAHTLPRHRICAICGGSLAEQILEQQIADSGNASTQNDPPKNKVAFRSAGDIVEICELSAAEKAALKPGEIVAVQFNGQLRIKRIAALGGDEITTDDGRIRINGIRVEDALQESRPTVDHMPRLVVDEDDRQTISRWKAIDATTSGWRRSDAATWTCLPRSNASAGLPTAEAAWSDWLVYHHRNVYQSDRPSEVKDDYLFNVGTARRLNPADRLAITIDFETDDMPAPTSEAVGTARPETTLWQAAFWTSDGIVTGKCKPHGSISHTITFYDSLSVADDEDQPPVTERTPLAIRCSQSIAPIRVDTFVVSRFVEYRVRQSDRGDLANLRIPQGQAFVVGDNVPVSIDSRNWGPIAVDSIVGRVINPTIQE